jgi:hypothetical protein
MANIKKAIAKGLKEAVRRAKAKRDADKVLEDIAKSPRAKGDLPPMSAELMLKLSKKDLGKGLDGKQRTVDRRDKGQRRSTDTAKYIQLTEDEAGRLKSTDNTYVNQAFQNNYNKNKEYIKANTSRRKGEQTNNKANPETMPNRDRRMMSEHSSRGDVETRELMWNQSRMNRMLGTYSQKAVTKAGEQPQKTKNISKVNLKAYNEPLENKEKLTSGKSSDYEFVPREDRRGLGLSAKGLVKKRKKKEK